MDYKKLNILTGWLVFLVAAWTYVSTIEPTASFWDCGEFIATAYKLQVGHPPGAPFFMITARIASAFVSPENVPVAVNLLSALCSAFTILFLFWSITHMAYKLALRANDGVEGFTLSTGSVVAVLGSGVVGALAYTWSDSFWFSAVEGEVYAMSSFFTAIVFWAILKWESEANKPHNIRWLILIAYLMGLSIGVHLLNLLAIPAIAFVYYFKRYPVTPRGVVTTLVVSALILGVIQTVIIPGIVRVAGAFELLFVNDLGLPFNTGNMIYGALLVAGIVWALIWTQRNGKVVLNTIVLGVTVILIGYSTFAMIVIRSTANPPIDENNPENVFNLLSYLNREQYGDRPLLMGQFWDSPYADERRDGRPVHTATWLIQKDGRTVGRYYDRWSARHFLDENPDHSVKHVYEVTDPRQGTEVVYQPEFTMIFPRMHSAQRHHIDEYKRWSEFKGRPMRATDREGKPTIIHMPTMGENLRFFFSYQMDWMYWRYFMWNFSGRQNDAQGHGNILEGNWISGVKAIDAQRLGNQDHLPDSITGNKAHNRMYMLPLLLGIIGLVYQMMRHFRDWTVTALLFFFTGIAIVLYLNQSPMQPRERDYAYVGSFYAFAIWIGLGVYALYDAARTITRRELGMAVGAAFVLGILKFLVEVVANDDHAVSYSIFYLAATGGLALGVFHLLGMATRSAVVAASLATIVGLGVPVLMVAEEWDDHDRSNRTPARDLAVDYLESCAPNAILFTNGDNDTFPLWYAQEVEGVRTDIRVVNLSLLNTDWYIDQMQRRAYESDPVPFSIPQEKYRQGTRDVVALIPSQNKTGEPKNLKEMIDFTVNDRNMQVLFQRGTRDAWFPTDRFSIPVDREKVIANGTVAEKDSALVLDAVEWQIPRQVLLKNHYMVLDLLGNFDWDRPIYFAVTTGPDSYIHLEDHFQLEGLAYRVVPIRTVNPDPNSYGRVQTDTMYRNVTERFLWGNMGTEGPIFLDENTLRMTTNLRLQLSSLAGALIEEGREDDARTILDLSLEHMPDRNVPYDRIMLPTIEAYERIGDKDKAWGITERLFDIQANDMEFYLSLEPRFVERVGQQMAIANAVMERLVMISAVSQPERSAELRSRLDVLNEEFDRVIGDLTPEARRNTRIRF